MAIGATTNMQWLGGQGGATVRYTGENGVIVNNSTDKISADFDVVQHKLTQGSNITISNNVISAQQPDVSQFVTSSEVTTQIENALANVREVPTCDASDLNKVLTADANNGYSWQPVPSGPSGVTDVKVDGTSVVTAGVANITMPSVPTKVSQLQNDSQFITLADVPAQVNADWESNSGASEILHKPDLSIYAQSANLATVATTGDYDDLVNKPVIPAAQVNSDWNSNSGVSQILNKPSLATVATTGDYADLSNKPSIPAAQINADWNANTGVAEILNKPTIPSVDQTYNASSTNAQSGTAVAQAIASIPSASYTAGNGIDITGNAISAKVDGTTITTNASGQLVATGSSPFTPVTTRFTVDGTSSIVSEVCPSVQMTQADTTYYYVPIPSSVFPTTGRYVMYGIIYRDMTLSPEPSWSSGQSEWGPKMSISKQDAITRAWNLQCIYTSPYGYPERSERYSISLQQYDKPNWSFSSSVSLRGARLETSGFGFGNTESWWNNPSGVSGVNRFYTISRCGWKDFIINDTSYIPNGVIVHSIYANQRSDTINDFYADLYFVKVAESPSIPYSSLVPANA